MLSIIKHQLNKEGYGISIAILRFETTILLFQQPHTAIDIIGSTAKLALQRSGPVYCIR